MQESLFVQIYSGDSVSDFSNIPFTPISFEGEDTEPGAARKRVDHQVKTDSKLGPPAWQSYIARVVKDTIKAIERAP